MQFIIEEEKTQTLTILDVFILQRDDRELSTYVYRKANNIDRFFAFQKQ